MTKFARIIPVLLLIALTLLFFWKLAFTDMILARGDTYAYFYPYWDARNGAFRAGELPLWTPDIFMGAPLLANPQLGTFYPPNWLTIPFRAPDAIRTTTGISPCSARTARSAMRRTGGPFLSFATLRPVPRIVLSATKRRPVIT